MRLLFAAIFLLAAPVLVIAHRQHYAANMQESFYHQLEKILAAPEFVKVEASLAYMDVTLQGVVPDVASREKARQLADSIRGLRCREGDNLIQVTARLDAMLTGRTLALSGSIHDEAALQNVTRWLSRARPGIQIDTHAVQINRYVTMEDVPTLTNVPAAFRSAWSALEAPASLKIVRSANVHVASGQLPSDALRKAVIASLPAKEAQMAVDAAQLEAGPYVKKAKFADAESLPIFLKAFFNSPGAMGFQADSAKITVIAKATPSMQSEWMTLLEPVARDLDLETQFQVFPSIYHFPGRPMASHILPTALTVLRDVLAATTINFAMGYATVDPAEQPKLAAATSAIIAAGPETHIVVGGHMDETGNPKVNETIARRRAESVIAELVGKGVPSRALESAVFEFVPGSAGRSRQVEFLIK
jgi:outer membrane protein OmpA-like peptidoglycan-associated protein